jgi:hypothetical protein
MRAGVYATTVARALECRKVNLRLMEKDDVPLLVDWWNSLKYQGKYFPVPQKSKTQALQEFENPSPVQIAMEHQEFIIEKKTERKSDTSAAARTSFTIG